MSRQADAGVGGRAGRAARWHGFAGTTPLVLAAAAGIAMLVVGTLVGRLVLDNAYGPLGYHGPLGDVPTAIGTSAAYSAGAGTGLATFGGTWWVARRSRLALVTCLAVGTAVVWVLFPQRSTSTRASGRCPTSAFPAPG